LILEPETANWPAAHRKGKNGRTEKIVEALKKHFSRKKKIPSRLKGKNILVTAGPYL